jgi:hypothetical protein
MSAGMAEVILANVLFEVIDEERPVRVDIGLQ